MDVLWPSVLVALELSAKTGELSTTPHPFGKPGGPGLWHVKGLELDPYIQNIAHALVRGGMDESRAIATAWGTVKRWASGRGKVHPEVRAAAAKAVANMEKKKAEAHSQSATKGHVSMSRIGTHVSYLDKILRLAGGDTDSTVAQKAQAVDAALDEAVRILGGVDTSSLPPEVQQAIGLVFAAEAAVDDLLDALGVDDPDEDSSNTSVAYSRNTPLGRILALAADDDSDSSESESAMDIDGGVGQEPGQLTSSGSVLSTSGSTIGKVTQLGDSWQGMHQDTGKMTPKCSDKQTAAKGVLKLHTQMGA
jgi:hypothetical protein